MMRSRKLTHQMSRYLSSATAEEDITNLVDVLRHVQSDLVPPAVVDSLSRISNFLDVVDASYKKYEENLAIAERNITVSSEELVQANRSIGSMVNSLGQGFLMFDGAGLCAPVYSRACETLLETIPAGKHISAVLRLNDEQKNKLDSLIRLAFSKMHAMSFDEIMRFAPRSYAHSGGAHVHLDYKPDIMREGRIDRIVLVATDVSEQVHAQALADERKGLFEMIERVAHDCPSFCSFIRRAYEITDEMNQNETKTSFESLLREVHTLKGGASMFRLNALVNRLHDLESHLQAFIKRSPCEKEQERSTLLSILAQHRNAIHREIDALAGYIGQLLGVDVTRYDQESRVEKPVLYAFAEYLEAMGMAQARKTYIENICAESLTTYLRRYDLVLDDLASRLNKKIAPIVFTGQDVRIIVDPYRALFESLVHLFRNIADHGIESPEDRSEKNKSEEGHIKIHTTICEKLEGEPWLILEISDDGAGIDMNAVRKKLVESYPDERWETADEDAVRASLLTKNITTCENVSIYSGRGTGMGAVHAKTMELGGKMTLVTTPGTGTIYRIEVPYRLELPHAAR